MAMFLDVKLQGVPDLSSFGDVYELGFGLGPDQPPTSAIVKKEFQRKIIYQLSPQEVLVFQYQTWLWLEQSFNISCFDTFSPYFFTSNIVFLSSFEGTI